MPAPLPPPICTAVLPPTGEVDAPPPPPPSAAAAAGSRSELGLVRLPAALCGGRLRLVGFVRVRGRGWGGGGAGALLHAAGGPEPVPRRVGPACLRVILWEHCQWEGRPAGSSESPRGHRQATVCRTPTLGAGGAARRPVAERVPPFTLRVAVAKSTHHRERAPAGPHDSAAPRPFSSSWLQAGTPGAASLSATSDSDGSVHHDSDFGPSGSSGVASSPRRGSCGPART